ncbi:hypothetical protein [Paracoccus sp. AK26]|uniref:hypothetical protein n=1 Tax=Paracoccus sp. AK26 TaxID=2589076 RepID=UPI0014305765|nr:hypothetical protein [Paracoccus sp. AK26]
MALPLLFKLLSYDLWQQFGLPLIQMFKEGTIVIAGGNRASTLVSVAGSLTFMICGAISAEADEFCSKPLPLAEGVQPALGQLAITSELITFPGLDTPMINLGAKTILTVEDGQLVPFNDPPLDLWNRLMPVLVRWTDGEIWAYSRVKAALYRFAPDTGGFVRLPLDQVEGLRGFSASGTKRRHEDRRRDHSNDGVPPLYALAGTGLLEITQDGVVPLMMPRDWKPGSWTPVTIENIGMFLPAGGEIWFRRDTGTKWRRIARLADVQSLYIQSPFEMFQVHQSASGDLWVMLEDRVLVGRIENDQDATVLDYQLSGEIIIHEPSGQVLVFPNEPLASNGREQPPLVSAEDALYEAHPGNPKIVPGVQIAQQRSGSVPLNSAIFHAPSGLTLIAHEHGVAGYDGKSLRDLPMLAPDDGIKRVLRSIGGRYVVDELGGGLAEISADLQLRPIQMPEDRNSLIDLDYSALLGHFILRSSSWQRMYTSPDLVEFSAVTGNYEAIVGLAGDLPEQGAVLVNSANSAYLIRGCDD